MGLGQLDFHPATELQLWNWQRNIIGASTQFWKDKRFILEREDRNIVGSAAARQRIMDAYPDGRVDMCDGEDQDGTHRVQGWHPTAKVVSISRRWKWL